MRDGKAIRRKHAGLNYHILDFCCCGLSRVISHGSYWIEMMLADLVRSAKEICSRRLLELDELYSYWSSR